ncbi:MAG: TlpA family protein disulfide reductase [Flavobacteriales bacterium]|nr:MAG: TlpA family protein disulfide reductase [Flavobacteriales bacterium]
MFRSFGLLAILLLAPPAFAQPLTATMGFPLPVGTVVKVFVSRGADRVLLDSASTDAQGRAHFERTWPGSGFYQLMLPDSDRVDFIIDVREPRVVLAFTGKPLQEHLHVVASEENDRLWEYKQLSREAQALRSNIAREREALPATAVLRSRELDSLERRTHAMQGKHLSRLSAMAPNGFFAKAVNAGRLVDNTANGADLLTTFNFADADLLRSTVYAKAVLAVIQLQQVYSEDSFTAAADSVLAHARPCTECHTYALDLLLGLFDQYGPEMVLQDLVERHVLAAKPEPRLSATLKARIDGLRTVAIGAVAPDVRLPQPAADSVSISSFLKDRRFLAIMFYSSTCDHCHAEMPQLAEALRTFGPKGFGAIGIALDPDRSEFGTCIAEHGITWPCFTEQMAWGSPAAQAFHVKATPSFYVLDTNLRIVAKPKDIAAMKVFLGSVL